MTTMRVKTVNTRGGEGMKGTRESETGSGPTKGMYDLTASCSFTIFQQLALRETDTVLRSQ